MQKTPAYSLMGRKDDSPSKLLVGPGQYDPSDRYAKTNSPSYSYVSYNVGCMVEVTPK